MSEELIKSKKNRLITHYRKLGSDRSYRRECGEFLADGKKLLQDALLCGYPINTVLLHNEGQDFPIPEAINVSYASDELIDYVSQLSTPQGALFACPSPILPIPERFDAGRYIVLDGVRDPGNVGTIIRSADAFCMDGIILTADCADPLNIKTVRGSMGGIFRQKIYEGTRTEIKTALERSKIPVLAAALSENAERIDKIDIRKGAIVIGNEGAGISGELLKASEKAFKIPMNEACQSLNAAVSASLIMWEMYKNEIK